MIQLPQWCIDGLAAAGLSAEGWDGGPGAVWIGTLVTVFEPTTPSGASVWVNGNAYPPLLPLPDAFLLASRLAAVLENKPCPKCAEFQSRLENHELYIASNQEETIRQLEAQVGRLGVLLTASLPFIGWGSAPDGLVDRVHAAVAALTPAAPTEPTHISGPRSAISERPEGEAL